MREIVLVLSVARRSRAKVEDAVPIDQGFLDNSAWVGWP